MDESTQRTDNRSPDFCNEDHIPAGYSRIPTSNLSKNINNNSIHSLNKNCRQSNSSTGSKMTLANSEKNVTMCSGCGEHIMDRYLLQALERYWHTSCLKCSCCNVHLGDIGTSCFTKNGLILCKNDYVRLFGSGGCCSACRQTIPAGELVMKAQGNVYHQKCFTCVACQCQLMPGDRYSILNGSLLCEQDYPKVLKGHVTVPNRIFHKVQDATLINDRSKTPTWCHGHGDLNPSGVSFCETYRCADLPT